MGPHWERVVIDILWLVISLYVPAHETILVLTWRGWPEDCPIIKRYAVLIVIRMRFPFCLEAFFPLPKSFLECGEQCVMR